MPEDNFDFAFAKTENILVSAYQERLEEAEGDGGLWAYCLRIENNSGQRIRLMQKDFCITDSTGKNHYEQSYGFHGELPDLEAGECFEFEDTVSFSGGAAVLYGCCHAVDESGKAFTVKLPMMQLTAGSKANRCVFH